VATFLHTIPVRFHDVDPAGIVFFARIFQYAHDAYEVWLRAIGFPLDPPIVERGYGLPLVHAEADFHSPIRLGQEVQVAISVAVVGTSSYTLSSNLSLANGTVLAVVRTVHVCMDPGTGRSRPLPDSFREAIQAYVASSE
jgi:YbgC/YbaW family acyl-CoA thioester hydrolase